MCIDYSNTFRSSAARIVSTVCCKVVSSTNVSQAPGCGMDAMKVCTELKSRRKHDVVLLVCNNTGGYKKKGIGKCEINKVRCMHIEYKRATSIHHARASKISKAFFHFSSVFALLLIRMARTSLTCSANSRRHSPNPSVKAWASLLVRASRALNCCCNTCAAAAVASASV